MHPDLAKLLDLQHLDLESKRLQDEHEALPRHLASLAARSAAAQAALLATEEAIAQEEKLCRSLQSDIRDQAGRAARAKRQMDAVTTQTQATALEHEIAFTSTEISRLEDAELESMVRTETLDKQKTEGRSNADAAETMLERERLRSADLLSLGSKRLAELTPARALLRSTIGEAALSIYDRIFKAKGTGIAEGVDQKCSACQMLIRPQKWNDLRDRSDDQTMMTCESCGRLLYWDPARDAPVKKPAPSTGSDVTGKAEAR